jgi:hypothetical protein
MICQCCNVSEATQIVVEVEHATVPTYYDVCIRCSALLVDDLEEEPGEEPLGSVPISRQIEMFSIISRPAHAFNSAIVAWSTITA